MPHHSGLSLDLILPEGGLHELHRPGEPCDVQLDHLRGLKTKERHISLCEVHSREVDVQNQIS
jgi:hypothetical protein